MKSFVKGLWSRSKKEPGARQLDHASDLMVGDLIKMSDSFGLPEELRNQSFKVVAVSTYQFKHHFNACFSLEGERSETVDLMIEEEGGRYEAVFSMQITRDVVEQLFDMDEFGMIFEGEELATLHRLNEPDEISNWTSDVYHQESAAERGYYYEADYRGKKPPEEEGEGEPFEYYSLYSNDESCAVEIEVWEDGDTDVVLSIFRPLDDIKELWPGSAGES